MRPQARNDVRHCRSYVYLYPGKVNRFGMRLVSSCCARYVCQKNYLLWQLVHGPIVCLALHSFTYDDSSVIVIGALLLSCPLWWLAYYLYSTTVSSSRKHAPQ